MPIDTFQDQVISDVTEIVAGELGVSTDELTPTTDLRRIQGADSVKVLRIIAKIERKYGVELEDEEVFGVTSIDEVTKIITRICVGEHAEQTP
jgi:acyl carrier protein